MKRLTRIILLVLTVLVGTGMSFAQGSFAFNNWGVNLSPFAPIYGPEPGHPQQQKWGNAADASPPGTQTYSGLRLAGTNYSVEAWYSVVPVADVFGLNGAAAVVPGSVTMFFTEPLGGLFDALAPRIPDIIFDPFGAYLQVRTWDNAGGQLPSWEQAWNAALGGSGRSVGWSKVFWQPVALGESPPPGMFNFESFNIFIVPEPSTFVLFGLGGLGLLLFWRRKCPQVLGK